MLIFSPMFFRCPADVLPFLPMWYRCAAVLVPIPKNRKICAPVLLRRAKSVRCDSAFKHISRFLFLYNNCMEKMIGLISLLSKTSFNKINKHCPPQDIQKTDLPPAYCTLHYMLTKMLDIIMAKIREWKKEMNSDGILAFGRSQEYERKKWRNVKWEERNKRAIERERKKCSDVLLAENFRSQG